MTNNKFDLLKVVEYGGCSAKLPAKELSELLANIPILKDSNVLVDIESHDDAGVYRLDDNTALVFTTDFFPPICSDAYQFGQIAATNALSDIYAMGGKPLLALNITMFPAKEIPMEVLKNILLGGQNKIDEAGAFTMGGHTIEDATPKYGLAVVGRVAPDRVITNCGVEVGQKLILTKPIGTGVIIAGKRLELCSEATYQLAIEQMITLNKFAGELMTKYNVKGATDVTGFGLMGHTMKMAEASGVTIRIDSSRIPILPEVTQLIEMGCIPGGVFKNIEYCSENSFFAESLTAEAKMICADPQTSGGIIMAVNADIAEEVLQQLLPHHPQSVIIGDAITKGEFSLELI